MVSGTGTVSQNDVVIKHSLYIRNIHGSWLSLRQHASAFPVVPYHTRLIIYGRQYCHFERCI